MRRSWTHIGELRQAHANVLRYFDSAPTERSRVLTAATYLRLAAGDRAATVLLGIPRHPLRYPSADSSGVMRFGPADGGCRQRGLSQSDGDILRLTHLSVLPVEETAVADRRRKGRRPEPLGRHVRRAWPARRPTMRRPPGRRGSMPARARRSRARSGCTRRCSDRPARRPDIPGRHAARRGGGCPQDQPRFRRAVRRGGRMRSGWDEALNPQGRALSVP